MNVTYRHDNLEFSFSDADIVDIDNWIPQGEYNPHNVRPFLLHDHGFTLAVVFADSLQDAIDEAVDAGKLDRFQVAAADLGDYGDTDEEQSERLAYLGNASEPFDIETLGAIELPNPPRSFVAQFAAAFAKDCQS